MNDQPPEFTLPSHCLWCGAYLMGGATQHEPDCRFLKMMEEALEESRKRERPQ